MAVAVLARVLRSDFDLGGARRMLMRMLPQLAVAATAIVLASATLAALLRRRDRLPQDAPNRRSLHATPIPRVGGLAIWAGAFPGLVLHLAGFPAGVAIGCAALVLCIVSLLDDKGGIHPFIRLAIHALAAVSAVAGLAVAGEDARQIAGSSASLVAAVVLLAWSANAFNFMDGSDGLAAAASLAGFGAYAGGAAFAGAPSGGYVALVAATVPFALANRPPARIFMGDSGSVPIGFLAGALGLGEWLRGTWPGWFPLLAFLPFIADATVTLARRLARRERVWEAHRSHYYQRYHRLGAGHRGTLRLYGSLMCGGAISAVLTLALRPEAGWWVLGFWLIVMAAVFLRIDYHWKRRAVGLE